MYGLLLVLCFVLLLVFGFNFQEDRKTNLLAILMKSGCGSVMEIYRNRYVNVREVPFVLSLIILSVVTYCVKPFGGNQLIIEYSWTMSVSIVFIATFIGILIPFSWQM